MAATDDATVKPVQFQWPFILLRSRRGLGLLDRLGRTLGARILGWFCLGVMPLAGVAGGFLIIGTVIVILQSAEARSAARSIPPLAHILIPGLNPYLPVFYGVLALIVALVIHEGTHGVLARSLGFRVKSTGLILFLAVPIGAFVDIDEKELGRAPARSAGRVLAGGPASNIAVAALAFAGMIAVVGTMSPVVPGMGVLAVEAASPAEQAGILDRHIVNAVNGSVVHTALDLEQALAAFPPGSRVPVGVWDGQSIITRELQQPDGVVVTGVVLETAGQPSPAFAAGVQPRDVVLAIDAMRVRTLEEFTRALREHRPGERIMLTLARNGTSATLNATLAARSDDPAVPFLGVELALLPSQALGIQYVPLAELVQFYTNPGLGNAIVYIRPPVPGLNEDLTPYSSKLQVFYTSSLGDWYPIWATALFWIWWVNFNVAIFNALPIYPLDGGQALKSLLQGVASKRLSESGINRVTVGITLVMVAFLGMMLAVPWFGA